MPLTLPSQKIVNDLMESLRSFVFRYEEELYENRDADRYVLTIHISRTGEEVKAYNLFIQLFTQFGTAAVELSFNGKQAFICCGDFTAKLDRPRLSIKFVSVDDIKKFVDEYGLRVDLYQILKEKGRLEARAAHLNHVVEKLS